MTTSNDTEMTVPGKVMVPAFAPPPAMQETLVEDPMIHRAIGNYLIVRKIGQGGMGVVYEARHSVLERAVALKILKQYGSSQTSAVKRFIQEAIAAARVGGRHTATVHDTGQLPGPDGAHYIVMEYLSGLELGDLLRQRLNGGLSDDETVGIGIQCCKGLHLVHKSGIVHRDLKPSNIFLAKEDDEVIVKLLDFGVAKIVDVQAPMVPAPVRGTRLETVKNVVVGTPAYMSPEQTLASRSVDQRADVFSLGCVLYVMLTKKVPFPGDDFLAILEAKRYPFRPVTDLRPNLYAYWNKILSKALAFKAEDRYQDMRELALDLAKASPSGSAILTHWWRDLATQGAPAVFSSPDNTESNAPTMTSNGVPEILPLDVSDEPEIKVIEAPSQPSSPPLAAERATMLTGGTMIANPSLVAGLSFPTSPPQPTVVQSGSSSGSYSTSPSMSSMSSFAGVIASQAPRRRRWTRLMGVGALTALLTGATIAVVASTVQSGSGPRLTPAVRPAVVDVRPPVAAPTTPAALEPAEPPPPVLTPKVGSAGPSPKPEAVVDPNAEVAQPARRKRHSGKGRRPETLPAQTPNMIDPNGLM